MSGDGTGREPRRRRDAAATRAAILGSATRRFAWQGFEGTGVREIAAEAGVDASLVNRYFGSKEGLFARVVERAFDITNLVDGDRATLAERLARAMVHGRHDAPDDVRIPLLLLLRSATEPRASELLRANLEAQDLRLLKERLGGPEAETRAALVIAQLAGFAILDQMIRPQGLVDADRERLVALLAESLATCIG